MATGDLQPGKHSPHDGSGRRLPAGEVVVGTGRISAARRVVSVLPTLPFSRSELVSLDYALAGANRHPGRSVSVYLGDLGPDPQARAEELLDALGELAAEAVLVAVSPGQRVVEVITGPEARRYVSDHSCKLAVRSMVASFGHGDLVGGLIKGLRMLSE